MREIGSWGASSLVFPLLLVFSCIARRDGGSYANISPTHSDFSPDHHGASTVLWRNYAPAEFYKEGVELD
jgi:hypothetical protein